MWDCQFTPGVRPFACSARVKNLAFVAALLARSCFAARSTGSLLSMGILYSSNWVTGGQAELYNLIYADNESFIELNVHSLNT